MVNKWGIYFCKIYPTEVVLPAGISGLSKDSIAMVQQVRTLAHSRLTNKVGVLIDPIYQEKIKEALRNYFEL